MAANESPHKLYNNSIIQKVEMTHSCINRRTLKKNTMRQDVVSGTKANSIFGQRNFSVQSSGQHHGFSNDSALNPLISSRATQVERPFDQKRNTIAPNKTASTAFGKKVSVQNSQPLLLEKLNSNYNSKQASVSGSPKQMNLQFSNYLTYVKEKQQVLTAREKFKKEEDDFSLEVEGDNSGEQKMHTIRLANFDSKQLFRNKNQQRMPMHFHSSQRLLIHNRQDFLSRKKSFDQFKRQQALSESRNGRLSSLNSNGGDLTYINNAKMDPPMSINQIIQEQKSMAQLESSYLDNFAKQAGRRTYDQSAMPTTAYGQQHVRYTVQDIDARTGQPLLTENENIRMPAIVEDESPVHMDDEWDFSSSEESEDDPNEAKEDTHSSEANVSEEKSDIEPEFVYATQGIRRDFFSSSLIEQMSRNAVNTRHQTGYTAARNMEQTLSPDQMVKNLLQVHEAGDQMEKYNLVRQIDENFTMSLTEAIKSNKHSQPISILGSGQKEEKKVEMGFSDADISDGERTHIDKAPLNNFTDFNDFNLNEERSIEPIQNSKSQLGLIGKSGKSIYNPTSALSHIDEQHLNPKPIEIEDSYPQPARSHVWIPNSQGAELSTGSYFTKKR